MNVQPIPPRAGWLRELWWSLGDRIGLMWWRIGRKADAIFGDKQRAQDDALAQRFKADATAIEEAPVPIATHAALYVILALLIIAVLWSIFGSLDRIVVAQGKVATRTPLVVMQPFTTSRIVQLFVKPGDHVKKGQALAAFDPAFAQADQASLEHKVRELTAQVDRITAEMNGARTFPVQLGDGPERRTQAQIFAQEMAEYSGEMVQRDKRVGALDSEIATTKKSIIGLAAQVELAKQVTSAQERLESEGAGATLDLVRAQSNQIDVETRLSNAQGDAEKYAQQRAESEAERASFLGKWRSDHNQQLVQTRQELAEARETLNKARRMSDLTKMTAPVDGVVLEIADRSVGSVLREAETLLTLVPDDADLYVEANVASRDVSYVRVGNQARVKLESYPFQRFGTLDGTLDIVSPDSVPLKQDDQSQLVYRVQIRLDGTPREFAARGIRLRPGLVTTAEITTGKRSIMSYVLDPILRVSDESMHEP
jgi:hemolysin D